MGSGKRVAHFFATLGRHAHVVYQVVFAVLLEYGSTPSTPCLHGPIKGDYHIANAA